jgi:hypothetical protein
MVEELGVSGGGLGNDERYGRWREIYEWSGGFGGGFGGMRARLRLKVLAVGIGCEIYDQGLFLEFLGGVISITDITPSYLNIKPNEGKSSQEKSE